MKNILLLILTLTAYYLYTNQSRQNFSKEKPNSIQDVILKLGTSQVSASEIIEGSSAFALELCDDTSYQLAGGETPSSCHAKFKSFKTMCAERIFPEVDKAFSGEKEVSPLIERFVNCVGT